MVQIVSLIAGKNKNFDHQLTALHKALINPWIISGLTVTAGQVAVGEAFIECTRSNGEKIMVHFSNTAPLNIDTSGNKKIFVEVKQEHIDNGILNAQDGSNIAEIKSSEILPEKNFLLLGQIINSEILQWEKIFLKNIPRKAENQTNWFVFYENGEEKILNDLPENINENIQAKILEKSGSIKAKIGENITESTNWVALAKVDKVKQKIPSTSRRSMSNSQNCGIKINLTADASLKKIFLFNQITSTTAIFTIKKWNETIKTVNGINSKDEVDFGGVELQANTDYTITVNDSSTVGGFFYNSDKRSNLNFFRAGIDWSREDAYSVNIISGYELDFGGQLLKANSKIFGFDNVATIVKSAKKWDFLTISQNLEAHIECNLADGFYFLGENPGTITSIKPSYNNNKVTVWYVENSIMHIGQNYKSNHKTILISANQARIERFEGGILSFNYQTRWYTDTQINIEFGSDEDNFKNIFNQYVRRTSQSSSDNFDFKNYSFILPKGFIKVNSGLSSEIQI